MMEQTKFKLRSWKPIYQLARLSSLLGVVILIFDVGFEHHDIPESVLDALYFIVLAIGIVATGTIYLEKNELVRRPAFWFDLFTVIFTLWLFYMYIFVGKAFETDHVLENQSLLHVAVALNFIRVFSEVSIQYKRRVLHPAQLFISSFLLLIILGTFLLMLPNSTTQHISFINALFTATSAVCVTGLIVVDTATYFTHFGQIIILLLIQIGGIGILTFSSYFAYFFKGVSSYENQLALSAMNNTQKLGEVFTTLKKIILITVIIEAVAAAFVFVSVQSLQFDSGYDKLFFSIFHSISAFCNAGFSTLSNNLYEANFQYNYGLQLAIILTFALGGLGFPIVSNILNYFNYQCKKLFSTGKKITTSQPWLIKINSRITLITTVSISVVAVLLFYAFEYQNTLADHNGFGKFVTALFAATTPRTAGFNTIDFANMLLPSTLLIILLMWIGASPASTGGGIKTSTFAIAIMNIISLAKGKERIEVFRREISHSSVRRAFATISLSLFAVGLAVLLISLCNPELKLLQIVFECFSAYSTVGLSMGITVNLSALSKLVLIALMFSGRVTMLTILIALFKKEKHKNYRYPTEEITIN